MSRFLAIVAGERPAVQLERYLKGPGEYRSNTGRMTRFKEGGVWKKYFLLKPGSHLSRQLMPQTEMSEGTMLGEFSSWAYKNEIDEAGMVQQRRQEAAILFENEDPRCLQLIHGVLAGETKAEFIARIDALHVFDCWMLVNNGVMFERGRAYPFGTAAPTLPTEGWARLLKMQFDSMLPGTRLTAFDCHT